MEFQFDGGKRMSSLAEQIDRQVKTGTELMTNARAKLAPVDSPRNRVAAGLMLAVLAAGTAIIIYSRRRRHTLAERFQKAMPDSVREFPEEIVAQLKRPIERAVRAL
jgi:hypothetical protein